MPRAGLDRSALTASALTIVDSLGPDGFSGLTLAGVAADVGVATPSLYKHVTSLAELRQNVATASLNQLSEAMAAVTIGRSGSEALAAMAEAIRGFAHEYPGRYAATQAAPDDSDSALAVAAGRAVDIVAAVLRGFGIAPDRMTDAIRIVRSVVHGFVMLELGGGFGLPDDVDRSFAILVETLVAGIETLRDDAGADARA